MNTSISTSERWLAQDQDSEGNTSSGFEGTSATSNPNWSSDTRYEDSESSGEAQSDHQCIEETGCKCSSCTASNEEGNEQTSEHAVAAQRKRGTISRSRMLSKSVSTQVISTQPYDVLLGRGKKHSRHPGNIRMHQIVNHHRDTYLNMTTRREKAVLTEKIVNFIKHHSGEKNGRFLRQDPLMRNWVEVSDDWARHKIGHALRDKPRHAWREGINIDNSDEGSGALGRVGDDSTTAATATATTESNCVPVAQEVKNIQLARVLRREALLHESGEKEEQLEERSEGTNSSNVRTADWLPRGWFDGPHRSSHGPGRANA